MTAMGHEYGAPLIPPENLPQLVPGAPEESESTFFSRAVELAKCLRGPHGVVPAKSCLALEELVPDIAAWLICALGLVALFRYVLIRRPKSSLFAALVWLAWLLWQVAMVEGRVALEKVKHRGLDALRANDEFAKVSIRLLKAWIRFFLPFLIDLVVWSSLMWSRMSARQQGIVIATVVLGYLGILLLQLCRNHSSKLMKLLLHGSFLIAGPLIWHQCHEIQPAWLPWCADVLLKVVPTVVSLLALGCGDFSSHRTATKSKWFSWSAQSSPSPRQGPRTALFRRCCLSYWACWPLLAVLQQAVTVVPQWLPNVNSAKRVQLEDEFYRAFLTFLLWLQIWQGSSFLNRIVKMLVQQSGICEGLAWFCGARGMDALALLRRGTLNGSLGTGRNLLSMMRLILRKLWLIVLATVLILALMCFAAWLCYRAFTMVFMLLSIAIWVFAAMDTTDILALRTEDLYSRKLGFWVVAMLWERLVMLKYLGSLLSLATPLVLALAMVAGESLLGLLVLPVLRVLFATVYDLPGRCFGVVRTSLGLRPGSDRQADAPSPQRPQTRSARRKSGRMLVEDTGGAGSHEPSLDAPDGAGLGGSTGETPSVADDDTGSAGGSTAAVEETMPSAEPSGRRPNRRKQERPATEASRRLSRGQSRAG
mmetsp:Transcript_56385/g.104318  ORF Transcript_56385/g.104318 Transcript_56385/m.104318 type:complete len:650 (-) Transcript_56385:31-1980(-)